ncbi:hypothetical protein DGWBC_0627 [Dehalogenimonas sp. WBC-2]|nr:hypothetical protein DGWBC_0627 [Dehalogenimonas sp. WBC-2]
MVIIILCRKVGFLAQIREHFEHVLNPLLYNRRVLSENHTLSIIGLVLTIFGITTGGYVLFELLFKCTLFTVFLRVVSTMLMALYPREPGYVWLTVQSSKSVYNIWNVALLWLMGLPIVLFLMIGFWVFIVLNIVGTTHIPVLWLVLWFIGAGLINLFSAVNQYAIELKIKHKRASVERLKRYILDDLGQALKRISHHFFYNWITGPVYTIAIFFIDLLLIILHWPAWGLNAFFGSKLDLDSNEVRKNYYIGYTVTAGLTGAVLLFLFS